MSNENRVLLAQLIGLLAIIGARFGIDISSEQQADLISGLSTFGLLLTALLAKAKPSGTGAGGQGGFARISLLAMIGVVVGMVLTLSACNVTAPQTPRQSLLAAYTTAETAAEAVGIAKADGRIDAEQRDALLAEIAVARDLLDATGTLLTNAPAAGAVNDSEATANLRAAQTILLAVQAALPKESPK